MVQEKSKKITITATSGLNEEEIQRMVDDAKKHAEEDKGRKKKVETKNAAENLVYQTEKQLKEQGDKIPDNIKKPVEADINELKQAIKDDNTEKMQSVMENLQNKMQKFAEELYKNAQQQGASENKSNGQQETSNEEAKSDGSTKTKEKDGDVIDADFDMVQEEKKK